MTSTEAGAAEEGANGRREHVLDVALGTFARYGYRKTSMEDVARAADISRPGLYFHFVSKQDLFRAAVGRALEADVGAAERSLAETGRPIRDRLIDAFDLWTGRYVGPLSKDVAHLIDTSPDILGPMPMQYRGRFAAMVIAALTGEVSADRQDVARNVAMTLLSTATGIKHEVGTREEFVSRMTLGVDVLLPALEGSRPGPP